MMRLPWRRPLPSNGASHCTFCSYGRLEAERVNQFWWNFVYNSKVGPQWQSRDQILKFLKFKMADGVLENIGNAIYCLLMDRLGRNLVVTSHRVPDMSAMVRLPWQRSLPSNRALNIQQLRASGAQMYEPILMKFGTQQQIENSMTVTLPNITFFKI